MNSSNLHQQSALQSEIILLEQQYQHELHAGSEFKVLKSIKMSIKELKGDLLSNQNHQQHVSTSTAGDGYDHSSL